MEHSSIVLVPCYRRPEYTAKCIKALEEAQMYPNTTFYLVDDFSNDGTAEILRASKLNRIVVENSKTIGLRNVILDFFKVAKDYKYMAKVDNDCIVPKFWLTSIIDFLESGWVDIVSPNVFPSDAAHKYGLPEEEGKPGIRPSKTVGGLWAMNTEILKGIQFERIPTSHGISGAFPLLNQIIVEKEPRIGWLPDVVVNDIGHWSGEHPDHIASDAHREYSAEVGRPVSW